MNDIGGFLKVKSDARILSAIKFFLSFARAPSPCLFLSWPDVGLRWGKMKPRTSITCRNVWLCCGALCMRCNTLKNGMECKCTDKTHSINAPCTTTRYFLFLWLSRHLPSFFVHTFFFASYLHRFPADDFTISFHFYNKINKYICLCAYFVSCRLQMKISNKIN